MSEWLQLSGLPEDGKYLARMDEFEDGDDVYAVIVKDGKAYCDGKQRFFLNYEWQKVDVPNVPEFHGNPNDYDFNPEFVFNLKAENAALQSKLTAERELSGALREALGMATFAVDNKSVTGIVILEALAQYNDHRELNNET